MYHYQLNLANTLKTMLNSTLDYYFYDGSSTTPNCTEKYAWVVVKEPSLINAN